MADQILGLKLPIKVGPNGYFDAHRTTIGQVSDNIKNLLLTKPGERRFNNSFGSGLYNLLFEQTDLDVNNEIIVDVVQKDIDRFLNGVIINKVTVKSLPDQYENTDKNKIFISVKFTYNKIISTTDVEITTNKI